MGEGAARPRVHPRSLPETPSPVPERRGRGRRRWHRPAGGARGAGWLRASRGGKRGASFVAFFTPAGLDVTSHKFSVLSHIRVTHQTPTGKITELPISKRLLARSCALLVSGSPSPE